MPVPASPTRAATITVSNLHIWLLRDVLMQCTLTRAFRFFWPRWLGIADGLAPAPFGKMVTASRDFEAPRRPRNVPFGPDLAVFTPTVQSGRRQARRRISPPTLFTIPSRCL